MMRSLLVRGLLAGLLATLVTFLFAYFVGEPQIDASIALETAKAAAAGEAGGPELVSRGVQSTFGLFVGLAVYGVAVGGLLSLVFATAHGRLGRLSPRGTALLVALLGFLVIILVPYTKYPGNPPAVGDPDTLDRRTAFFLVMLLVSLFAALAALRTRRDLLTRLGSWNATLAGVGVFVVLVVVAQLALPSINEVGPDFPAATLWRFRVGSLGTHLVMWSGIGLVFGVLAQRVLEPGRARPGATLGAADPTSG